MYSGGSGLSIDIHFVDIELSYDVLSPLPIVLSKHFNHPHPYIEIATAISDTHTLRCLSTLSELCTPDTPQCLLCSRLWRPGVKTSTGGYTRPAVIRKRMIRGLGVETTSTYSQTLNG